MRFEKEREEVRQAGIKLDRYGLIALSGGNVSVRLPSGEFLVTPSGMIYEDMVPADVLVLSQDGTVIDGTRTPSVDTEALLYIFQKMPHINAVVHTHQPYATAVGLIADELPCIVTTLPNATKGAVKVCPFSSAASIDMGIQTVENCGDTLAVILKHHGVMALGTSLKQALYSCIYLEEAAKTFIFARSVTDKVAVLSDEQVQQAVEVFRHYGQGKK